MPWKESNHVTERMRFVMRLEEGERMTDLCREFGVSRKTGYKIWERYRRFAALGLFDEPRRPERIPHRMSLEIESILVEARKGHPTWGPRKLRAWLIGKHPELRLPASSTIGDLLKRKGLIANRRRKRSSTPYGVPLSMAMEPNDVWGADFKGQFRLGSGNSCYPLTISDQMSRYLLGCEALEGTDGEPVRAAFEVVFREYGLPRVMRTDNGTPFSSCGLAGLSKLSVWWMRLGITHERIERGHPEQNGRHERMHLTLKIETTRPAAATLLQQQDRFERFQQVYNVERPHEALGQRPPATCYHRSERSFPEKLPEPEYPLHDLVLTVSRSGHIRLGGRRGVQVFLSSALAGERVGLREIDEDRWLVSFTRLDLGELDLRKRRFDPLAPELRDHPGEATS